MIELLRSLRDGKHSDPVEVLRAMTARLPADARAPTLELLELVREADSFGPPDPPEWLEALLRSVGRELGLSPWLLAAVSWHLVEYHPGARPSDRRRGHGVLGIPPARVEDPDRYGAEPGELLQEKDLEELEAAVARVKRGAELGARLLKVYHQRSGSLAGALRTYLDGAAPVGVVVGTFATFIARQAPGTPLELEAEPARARLQLVDGGG